MAWWSRSAVRRSSSLSPTDYALQFLQLTAEPVFLFRVSEKMVLRIKEPPGNSYSFSGNFCSHLQRAR